MRRLIVVLVLMLSWSAPPQVSGHVLGQSYVFLDVADSDIGGRFEIAVGDLNRALGLDFATDGSVTEADVAARAAQVKAYVLERVRMAPDGEPATIQFTGEGLFSIRKAQYVSLPFTLGELARAPAFVDMDYGVLFDVDPDHSGLVVIQNDWKSSTFNDESNVVLVFSPDERQLRLDLTSGSVMDGFMGMLGLGTHHILIGIDHVLFLLALLLPSVMRRERRHWEPVREFRTALIYLVKIVTVFTVAHTITLSLAALQTIVLPSRLVESVIAASIAIAAVDIFYPIFRRRIWLIVFVFGLFHGFGFASVLGEMGIPGNYMVLSLLAFNLGVEVGQLAIVCVAFPLLFVARNSMFYARYAMHSGAAVLIVISLYWFIERAFEVDLPAGELVQKLIGVVA